jgi:GMP synthase (glutamine-hydrolysing)
MSAPVVLVVHNDPGDPVGRLDPWLRDSGVLLDHRRAYRGELPDDLTGFAGLVVLGGPMNCQDDARAPWLTAVRALLRDAVATELPTLAICLGAQLLAVANGGVVGRNPDGPEFGAQLVAKRSAASTDPLFGPVPITPDVVQWHVDAVTTLPPGAILLAASPTCEVQAFRLGRLAWGLQFHIETTPAVVQAWAEADDVAADGYDVPRLVAGAAAVHDDLEEVWQPFTAAFAAIVTDPSSVAPARQIATSTAAPITDPAAIRAALAAEAQAAQLGPSVLPMPGLRPDHDA